MLFEVAIYEFIIWDWI